jgi:hypothetical protein
VNAWQLAWSQPFRVRGTVAGMDHERAMREAATLAYRACGLLGLTHGFPWIIREAPRPRQAEPIRVPDSVNVSEDDVPLAERANLASGRVIPPPRWLAGAWGVLDRRPNLAKALTAYQQGLELVHLHPSQAGVALVAAVETIGSKLTKIKRCPECGQPTGFASAFRDGLRAVLPEPDAAMLDGMYSSRSKTAHEGRLYGSEARAGLFLMPSVWAPPEPEFDFQRRQLWALRGAAQRLIIQQLSAP